MKSILVVGGTGVISYAVVNEAIKQGFKVTCINRGKSKSQSLNSSVEIIKADYRNKELIASKIENRYFDAIIDVLCYNELDIEYSVALFGSHCKQYIFFSSAEAYNKPVYKDFEYDETAELTNPLWKYSIDKANCERKLIALSNNYDFYYTIIRPAITYGNTRIPYGLMPAYGYHGTIIQRILNKKPILLYDGGESYATFIRVEDFAIGLIGLIGNSKAFNQAFHISGDEKVKWKTIIDILGKILNEDPIYVSLPSKVIAKEIPSLAEQIIGGRCISQKLDNTKMKNAVPNFKTNITLLEGIRMTVDYYKSHNYLSGIDYKFDANMDRIITKISKKRAYNLLNYKLGFVDYLGTATTNDRFVYWSEFNKENEFVALLTKVFTLSKKISNKITKAIFH